MSPTVTRSELNNSEDIIREVGVERPRRISDSGHSFGSPLAGCKGKVPFLTKIAAEQVARRGTASYRCRYCRHWHVGGVGKC
jgi:hypothetical protein